MRQVECMYFITKVSKNKKRCNTNHRIARSDCFNVNLRKEGHNYFNLTLRPLVCLKGVINLWFPHKSGNPVSYYHAI